jgi:GTPase SAR1 family protein
MPSREGYQVKGVMTVIIEGVILGVLGNAATSTSAWATSKFGRMLIGKELLEKWKIEETALQPMLRKAADALAEVVELGGPVGMEEVCLFLVTPEVEAILRQIYAARLMEDDGSINTIRAKFLRSFSTYVDVDEEILKESSVRLFNALLEACEYTLGQAIDRGILSAHEAKSEFRYGLLRDELDIVRKNTDYLVALKKPDVDAILQFEKEYRSQLASRHGFIIPPSFDAPPKLPINDIYVTPNFVPVVRRGGEEASPRDYPDFVSGIHRAVLLGDPGGGKSTFTEKLCYDIAARHSERLIAGRELTPILVVLRDYGAEKAAHGYSILDFIERKAVSTYQLDSAPPGALKYLLLNGRAMVIFDGLDELLNTNRRREISGDIESFCNYYSSVPVLITSRKVGYEQAPLDESKFEIFRLDAFDNLQVEEYATNWFAADANLTADERERKTKGFIEESRIAPDLRSNPLMLALMCNIYRRENHIPKNRPEVYRKCAEMLFERWDSDRGIVVHLDADAYLRPAVMYLAHWIYTNPSLQEGITERKLIAKMTDYLCPKFYEHLEDAEPVARGFVEFCKGRAWVFSGAGRTAEDEELYKFTHRTFLEYFTAYQFVRLHRTPTVLAETLLPRIAKKEWDNVAEMAFHVQEESVEGAWDELLEVLMERASGADADERENLLTFAARCLQFMVPSAGVQRKVTSLSVESCITWGLDVIKLFEEAEDYYPFYKHDMAEKMIGNLLRARSENLQTVVKSFEQILVERAKNGGDDVVASLALELGLHPTLAEGGSELQSASRQVWEDASGRIFDTCLSRVLALSPQHLWLCVDAFWRGKVSIDEFASWHGVSGIFRYREMEMFPNKSQLPIAEVLTRDVLIAPYFEKNKYREERLGHLGDVGRLLLSSPPPWIHRPRTEIPVLSADSRFPQVVPTFADWRFDEDYYCEREQVRPLELTTDALFGFFAVFALAVQTSGLVAEIVRWVKRSQFAVFDLLRWSLIAPYTGPRPDVIRAEVVRCGFTREQQEFVMQWSQGKLKLVQS